MLDGSLCVCVYSEMSIYIGQWFHWACWDTIYKQWTLYGRPFEIKCAQFCLSSHGHTQNKQHVLNYILKITHLCKIQMVLIHFCRQVQEILQICLKMLNLYYFIDMQTELHIFFI